MNRLPIRFGLRAVLLVNLFAGCQTAYHGMMEKFGVEKRDLLKKAVTRAPDEQKDASEEFKDALTRL